MGFGEKQVDDIMDQDPAWTLNRYLQAEREKVAELEAKLAAYDKLLDDWSKKVFTRAAEMEDTINKMESWQVGREIVRYTGLKEHAAGLRKAQAMLSLMEKKAGLKK